MIQTENKAFTLVELIVVVTILAILATIGFVSYSSYLTGVRDTNRLAQLVSISDGLELYRIKKDLPLPNDNVEVQSNTETIAYQGYAGSNTLETIDFTKGGQDPRDKQYFSYYLTNDRKYFQLMGFLEEGESLSTSNGMFSQTYAVDYTSRIPAVYGKKLGILTDTNNNPIQEIPDIVSAGKLDIITDTNDYIAHFSDNSSLTGSGQSLFSMVAVRYSGFSKYDPSLATYFNFDNSSLRDGSKNQLQAGKNGNSNIDDVGGEFAAYIGGGSNNHLVVPNTTELQSGLTDFSLSAWTRLDIDLLSGTANENYHIMGNEEYQDMGFLARIEHRATTSESGRIYFRTNGGSSLTQTRSNDAEYPNDNEWHHLSFVKNGTTGTIYLDGEEVSGYSESDSMQDYDPSTNDFAIGAHTSGGGVNTDNFLGHLDDIRVYNRAIDITEIENLYTVDKKVN